uniref:Alpha-1,4-N-acetylglucosaminyltransferase EXTL2 n=2 Tax=Tetraselmis sp. GSL018 TaxID=582737 RepID=A0A061QG92_9CHLO|mmetsp:Transcript_33580/g.79695  ORF Transcript_33580/g.79695 Transcript_33580/m.79695 type:complete len:713 (+) Transcript_33580:343-2481(+)
MQPVLHLDARNYGVTEYLRKLLYVQSQPSQSSIALTNSPSTSLLLRLLVVLSSTVFCAVEGDGWAQTKSQYVLEQNSACLDEFQAYIRPTERNCCTLCSNVHFTQLLGKPKVKHKAITRRNELSSLMAPQEMVSSNRLIACVGSVPLRLALDTFTFLLQALFRSWVPSGNGYSKAKGYSPASLRASWCHSDVAGSGCFAELSRTRCSDPDGVCSLPNAYGTQSSTRRRLLGDDAKEKRSWGAIKIVSDTALVQTDNAYKTLPARLGDTAEITCGPFTRMNAILEAGHTVSSLTLMDPHTFHYMAAVNGSAYQNGRLEVPNLTSNTIAALSVGDIKEMPCHFDTVIMGNEMDRMTDTPEVFESVYRALRPGGFFMWCGRLGVPQNSSGVQAQGLLRGHQPDPIRLEDSFADRFISVYDGIHSSRDAPEDKGSCHVWRKRADHDARNPHPAASDPDKITIILMTHPRSRRLQLLQRNMERYHAMDIVRHIILVLNGARVPFDLAPYASKLILKWFSVNSMNNRFRVSREVFTESVFLADDDDFIPKALLVCLHSKWSEEKDRLFGLDTRSAHLKVYKKGADSEGFYSSVLGRAMIFHRKYLDQYVSDEKLLRYIHPETSDVKTSDIHFCEDLAMVALISNATGKAPMAVRDRYHHLKHISTSVSLCKTRQWIQTRTRCVGWLNRHFDHPFRTERARLQCRLRLSRRAHGQGTKS